MKIPQNYNSLLSMIAVMTISSDPGKMMKSATILRRLDAPTYSHRVLRTTCEREVAASFMNIPKVLVAKKMMAQIETFLTLFRLKKSPGFLDC